MADFKKRLDEKIRKLQILRELADDPDMLEVMRWLVGTNGNGHKAPQEPAQVEYEIIEEGFPLPRPRGLQKKTVLEVLRSATEPVTTDWIVEQMIKRGFEFKSANRPVAVNEALKTLADEKQAKVARTVGVRNYWKAVAPKDVPFQMEAQLHA
jgi:hypothetical protein